MVARKNNSLHPKQAKHLFPVAKAGSFMPPVLPRTSKMDAKAKNQKEKPAYQNTGNRDFGGKYKKDHGIHLPWSFTPFRF